jgi:hypothetical protein
VLPARTLAGWWEPAVNLLGCIFFGISAIAGYVVPGTGSMLDLAASNWNTSLGAACFLGCALATLRTGARPRSRGCGCATSSTLSQPGSRRSSEKKALIAGRGW